MLENRPSPEELLKKIQEEGETQGQGKLKIFFGYAAGVGKTYAMLKAAHEAKKFGIDVVAGYIEPHTRPETMKLLNGLEILPPLQTEHKGITLKEFDLDGAIKRSPKFILVDELAHTNLGECRHMKRYQDIGELLRAGINVYTTVNVQHIESLNDIIASITGIVVKERIPDHLFDNADQVELVDIEPEDLINRLNQGKIYKEKQAQNALKHFFNLNNLIALREIALRRTADRVNKISERTKSYLSSASYYTDEHILICLSPSPSNAKVIRTAARMASAFKGTFTALFVETPSFKNISKEDKKRLSENLRLAEQLGARIDTVSGEDVALQISEYAHISGVSKVVIGRTHTRKKFFFSKPSFAERLTVLAPNLDIYIIPDQITNEYRTKQLSKSIDLKDPHVVGDTLKAVLFLSIATIVGLAFQKVGFSEANIITVYILSVLLTAIATSKKRYSMIASVLSVLVFNFIFTVPRYTLTAYDEGYPVTFVIMFLAAFITGTLMMQVKAQSKEAVLKAYRTKVLLETSQKLQQAEGYNAIIIETAKQLVKLLDKTIVFYKVNEEGLSEPEIFKKPTGEEEVSAYVSVNEKAVAQWVYKNNKHAGATTQTLPNSKCLYLAVRGKKHAYAVVGVALNAEELGTFENSLLISLLGECALALEKEELNETKKQTAMKAQQEQLRANLLRAISHDLRTPLTSISGNAGILIGNSENMDEAKKKILYQAIYEDSIWLISLVENLLSITKIEEGTMTLHRQAELIDEVVREALRHINPKSIEHTLKVEIEDDLMMAQMDAQLIMQVIINIIDNAIKYTPVGSTISISTKKKGKYAIVSIADNGKGISNEAKPKLFNMFYTENSKAVDSRRGLGLGLSLCKSIITAHEGTIKVNDNKPQGTIFSFTLPLEEVIIND